jgi:hypothetical protein
MNQFLVFLRQNRLLWLVAALTLGLAPFQPEPHLWQKLKWIMTGATGMAPIDWFDTFLHGSPWLLLLASLFVSQKRKVEIPR